MKNQFKILVVVLLASLFIGSTLINAGFSVTIGLENSYDVIESKWDYTYDAWDASGESVGTGFEYNEQLHSLDNQIDVTVTGADNLAVEYDVTIGTETETHYASGLSVIGIFFLLHYPISMVASTEWEVMGGIANLGLGLQHIYFIEPSVADESFTLLADDTYIASEYVDDEDCSYNYVNGIFDTDDNIAVFTWSYNVRVTESTDDTDVSGEYSMVIEYDQTTGELHRYKMEMDYSGIWGFDSVSVESTQEVKIQGYQNNSPGFSWFTAIPGLVVLGLFSVIINKRKKINRK